MELYKTFKKDKYLLWAILSTALQVSPFRHSFIHCKHKKAKDVVGKDKRLEIAEKMIEKYFVSENKINDLESK
jgi:hypothetical protein